MGNINSLVPLARPYVFNCTKILIERELLRAARLFFQRTQVWRKPMVVAVAAGQTEGEFDLSKDEQFVVLLSVRNRGGGAPLPKKAYSASTTHLRLTCPPAQTFLTDCVVAIKPSLASDSLPDALIEEYGEFIASGAVEALLEMPGTAWFDPNMGARHGQKFRSAITSTRIRIIQEFSNRPSQARGPKFL